MIEKSPDHREEKIAEKNRQEQRENIETVKQMLDFCFLAFCWFRCSVVFIAAFGDPSPSYSSIHTFGMSYACAIRSNDCVVCTLNIFNNMFQCIICTLCTCAYSVAVYEYEYEQSILRENIKFRVSIPNHYYCNHSLLFIHIM